jgi:hypothetical protein
VVGVDRVARRQIERGCGVVAAVIEIEQREHVEIGVQDTEDPLVLGEDGEEGIAPPST